MASDRVDSVLAYVAGRFSGQTETVATAALGYVLSRSAASRRLCERHSELAMRTLRPLSGWELR